MQTLFTERKKRGLLSSGLGMLADNKRYLLWFWLLNLVLAWIGTSAFRESSHVILDHSLYSNRLVQGFDLSVMIDLLVRPEFGPMVTVTTPAVCSALLFFLAIALFLPGVFQGYASTYRLPREDFFRACGRNLWRFIRLMMIAGIVMGIFAGALFALNGALVKKAGESTYELLPFEVQLTGLALIFLVMTTLRIWFDLAEADVVLNDQNAVRKSIAAGFRHTFRSLRHLLATYVMITIGTAILLVGGLWTWMRFVAPESVLKAFAVSQLTLLLLLIPRFWQRGAAVSYWQQRMLLPVAAIQPIEPEPIKPQVTVDVVPDLAPVIPDLPPAEPAS
jgi:hypothetical protein